MNKLSSKASPKSSSLSIDPLDAAKELKARRDARAFLLPFAQYTFPGYKKSPHLQTIARALEAVERREITRLMIFAPPRHGKAISDDTLVLTPKGWKTHGDLRIGDYVYAPNGNPVKVLAVTGSTNQQALTITFSDGNRITASYEHDWIVGIDRDCKLCQGKRRGHRHEQRRETQHLLDGYLRRAPSIPVAQAVQGVTQVLPIEPYTLGLWLGDGRSDDSEITVGATDIPALTQYGSPRKRLGTIVRYEKNHQITAGTIRPRGLKVALQLSGLIDNKHIPPVYFAAPQADRLALLQGLMDTDGYVSMKGQCEYTSIKPELARDVRLLIQTLGMKATLLSGRATLQGRDCGAKYRVMFYPLRCMPFRLERKKARVLNEARRITTVATRYIKSVESSPSAMMQCIQVEGGMYLAGEGCISTSNSELTAIRFPAWYLGRNPQQQVIGCSYAESLAYSNSWAVLQLMRGPEYQALWHTEFATEGATRWQISGKENNRASFLAAGVGGGITGEGADLLIIDDPTKNQEEADSAVIREKQWNWYTSVARTRLQPNAVIVLIMTRWNVADLAGRLLSEAAIDPKADQWTVLHLKALDNGQALWPEQYPADILEQTRATIGSMVFESLYQGSPTIAEGNIFKREWWQFFKVRPDKLRKIQSWDTAFKDKSENDYSVCTTWGISGNGYYLLDVARHKLEFPELKRMCITAYERDKPERVYIEDKASGQSLIQELKRETRIPLYAVKVDKDKIARANAVTPLIESGRVHVPEYASWLHDYLEELSAFPNGEHDDQVDSTTQALSQMANPVSYGFGFIGEKEHEWALEPV